MKKILLVSLIGLFAFLGFSIKPKAFDETEINQNHGWDNFNIISTYYAMQYYDIVPSGITAIDFWIPATDYITNTLDMGVYGDFKSQVIFYDSEETQIVAVDISDYFTLDGAIVSQRLHIDFSLEYGGEVVNEASYIKVVIAQTYSSIPPGYYNEWIESASVFYFPFPYIIYYYLDNTIVKREVSYNGLITYYDPTAENPTYFTGKIFTGWMFKDGNIMKSNTMVNDSIVESYHYLDDNGGEVIVGDYLIKAVARALVVDEQIIEENEQTTGFLSEFLAMFNANNDFGFSLVWLLLTIVLVIVFLLKRWPVMGATWIHIILTILFWVFGFIKIYVVIPMAILYVIIFISEINKNKTGGVINE